MTLIANLFGGPGTGKSTTALEASAILKKQGRSLEFVPEFAKDLTWEKRNTALTFQPYVIGKQMYRIYRLLGQVEVIITDSPILLGLIYADANTPPEFRNFVLAQHRQWKNLNFFLERNNTVNPFDPKGRNQTYDEAINVDVETRKMLDYEKIPYTPIKVNAFSGETIANYISANTWGSRYGHVLDNEWTENAIG